MKFWQFMADICSVVVYVVNWTYVLEKSFKVYFCNRKIIYFIVNFIRRLYFENFKCVVYVPVCMNECVLVIVNSVVSEWISEWIMTKRGLNVSSCWSRQRWCLSTSNSFTYKTVCTCQLNQTLRLSSVETR